MSDRKVAFITGASRGIGRASALALAEKGYDIVVTARTVVEGQAADGRPLPGSIQTTADEVRKLGREALAIPLDLLDPPSIDAAVAKTLAEWGHIDVLLNNAIYVGDGIMAPVLELTPELIQRVYQGNVFSQLHTIQQVLPGMLQRGSGCIINMISGAGMADPPAPGNQGGWGFAYGSSKAAFQRMVGVIAVEHRDAGLRLFNVEPGLVLTEAMKLNDPDGKIAKENVFVGAPMEVPAAVIAWLATEDAALEHHAQTVIAQRLCLKLQLQPDWR